MAVTIKNEYIYSNLTVLDCFNDTTKLCIYKPDHSLYVVKRIDSDSEDYYKTISNIDSPYIARIFYIAKENNAVYIMREYVAGKTLNDIIKEEKTLTQKVASQITEEICKGLSVLHLKNLVHRDINPNNIIISPEGHAKIIDYGIVRKFGGDKTSDTVILGTPGYAAPEQFGFDESNARTDIYSVGVLLNIMLTGKLPNEQIASGRIGKIIEKCTRIDWEQRYSDVMQVATAIKGNARQYDYEGKSSLDRFLSLMPGIRSHNVLINILAVIGYIIAGFFTFAIFYAVKGGVEEYILTFIIWIFMLLVPFFCFHNFLGIWDKIPFSAGSSKRNQRKMYIIIGIMSIIISLVLIGSLYPS